MAKFLYKDYQLVMKKLCKFGLKEKSHLLWQEGGVPCIDAALFDKHKDQIEEIYIATDKKRTFRISKDVFDIYKKEINFGFGRQYTVLKMYWDIKAPEKERSAPKLPL